MNVSLGGKGDDQDEVQDEEVEKERIKQKLIDDEEEDRKLLESIPDESMSYTCDVHFGLFCSIKIRKSSILQLLNPGGGFFRFFTDL